MSDHQADRVGAAAEGIGERPTRVRYAVLGAATLMSLLLYLDRFCISFLAGNIKDDLRLDGKQVGWLLSAFFITYAMAQVPSGWLTDRFGSRRMLTLYILAWSVCTALTGLASGFAFLLVMRAGIGLSQAGAYPTAASVISKWMPLDQRGVSSSIVALGGRLGGSLSQLMTAFLIVYLVPIGADATLTTREIVDPTLFAERALPVADKSAEAAEASTDTGAPTAAESIGARLCERSPGLRELLESLRGATAPADEATRQQLAEKLNVVLEQPDPLYAAGEFAELKLPKESVALLDRLSAGETLGQDRSRRLQRLLVETAYPTSLGKLYGRSWRRVIIIYGALGVFVAAAYWWIARDEPAEHPRVNRAEQWRIDVGRPPAKEKIPLGPAPVGAMLASGSMWMNCINQFCTNIGWAFIVTWMPTYLDKIHKVPVEERGWMAFTPLTIGMVGMFLGGVLTDRLVTVVGVRWGRALPMSLSRLMAAAAYIYCVVWHPSPWVAVIAFSLVAFSTDLGTAAIWAYCQDVGGRHVGSVLGWGNMAGNFGAAASPLLLQFCVDKGWEPYGVKLELDGWDAAFWVCAAAFLIAGASSLLIDATKVIVKEE